MNEMGWEPDGVSADPTVTGGRPPDRDRLEELRSAMTEPLARGERAYYLEITAGGPSDRPSRTVRLLEELANAMDLRGSIPEPSEVSSSDESISVLVVSTFSPTNIYEAIDEQECIEDVSLWELEIDTLPVAVVDRPDPTSDRSAEFDRLRAVYDGGNETDEFDSLDPERVAFADDELTYEEVLDAGQDDSARREPPERGIEWGTAEGGTAEGEMNDGKANGEKTNDGKANGEKTNPGGTVGGWTNDGGQDEVSVVARLAAELERSDRTDEHVAKICRHLAENRSRTSVDVRLRHVQSQLNSIQAYADALEAFLDENGTAEQLIEGFRTEIAGLDDEVEAVRARTREAAAERASIRERLDALEAEAITESELDEELASVEREFDDKLADVEREIDRVDADRERDRANVDATLDSLRERQERQERWRTRIQSVFSDVDVSTD